MVTIHRELISRLPARTPRAVLLATPYAFQENADGVTAKASRYFARSVGLDVGVATATSPDADPAAAPPLHAPTGDPGLRTADWVFAGPGNPTYALAHWQAGPVARMLRDRVLAGDGITVLASAAAATAGRFAFPVYEIYKAGARPRWFPGLDLLTPLGLTVAVIPHYDNTEGKDHDTRYCYLGARRLAALESGLPPDCDILGLDEHTAAIFDLCARTVEVRGHGALTLRHHGTETTFQAGSTMRVSDLKPGARAGRISGGHPARPGREPAGPRPLPELIETANSVTGPAGMVAVILELETAIADWAEDTEQDQGTEQARAALRTLVSKLGQAAQAGLADPRDRLRSAVEPLLAVRSALREQGSYAAADEIRAALAAAGIEVRDAPDGSSWQVTS
jgi:hypothetical protein